MTESTLGDQLQGVSQCLSVPRQVRDERVEALLTEVCNRAADARRAVEDPTGTEV